MDLRDIFIFVSISGMALYALRKPQVGLLGWLWISVMVPHKMAYGFIYNMPLLDGTVALTVLGCIIHWKDRAPAEFHPILRVLLAFYVWCCLTTLFAVNNPAAYNDWQEVSKTFLLVYLLLMFMNKKHWIVACIAVFLVSVAFNGIKGGLFKVVGGGGSRVWGPPGGMWGSNNAVALVMVMTFPLFMGIARIFENKLYRLAAYGTALLCVFCALGTQSRGALVGLVAVGGAMVLRSRHKLLALVFVPIVFAGAFLFYARELA
jgi:putative inorganic carbon (HCO3(-)) transporter